jgi:tetratricopeptide (TPR) repeat protein
MHTQQLLTTKDCASCDLTKAGLVYANLIGANLGSANLVQANLSHTDLSGANLSQAQLSGAVLFGANLSNADLRGADLRGADLREAILTNANLEGANIEGANLMGAVGIPATLATVDNFYRWGLEEAARGNFRAAINNYNQAISQDADFAHGYLARSIALFRLGDQAGALADAQRADELYLAQNNEQGHQVASQFALGIQAAQEAYVRRQEGQNGGGAGGNILNVLGGLAGMALQVLQYVAF